MNSLLSRSRIWLKTVLKTVLVIPGLVRRLADSRRPGLRVLFYHRVNPYPFDKLGPVSRETTVRPEAFARQLAYLRRGGFRSLTPDELIATLAGRVAADEKSIAITFDDGYEDNLLWAGPLLKEHGFTAIVFVVTGCAGKESSEVWPGEGDQGGYGRFLSLDQLRGMSAAGMFLGSHTRSHRPLTGLGDREVLAELEDSRRVLEEITGAPVRLLAYPLGDFDHRSESAAARAGYAASFTTIPGVNGKGGRPHALCRTEVSASDSFFLFRMKVAGALDWLWFKEAPALRRALGVTNRWLLRLTAR